MADQLKIAITSDLHCKGGLVDGTANLFAGAPKKPVKQHPVEALKKFIKDNEITADILLCPGDIAHQIDPTGLSSGWTFIEEINASLGSDLLVATLGNHDVDFKNVHKKGPFYFVKKLKSNYPSENTTFNNEYWANTFSFIEGVDFRIFVFNSCHNYLTEADAKITEIAEEALEEIEEYLKSATTKSFSFAMCHHHPISHSLPGYGDGDIIKRGDALIDILEKYNFQIFIHGHKHDPKIRYLNSLPIFAVGSFSALLTGIKNRARNVFHLVTLNSNSRNGTIETWEYTYTDGWHARLDQYFPKNVGFGYTGNLAELAKKCTEWIEGAGGDLKYFDDLISVCPDIEFIIPSDLLKLDDILRKKYSLDCQPPFPNKPRTIGKLMP